MNGKQVKISAFWKGRGDWKELLFPFKLTSGFYSWNFINMPANIFNKTFLLLFQSSFRSSDDLIYDIVFLWI